MAMRRLLKAKNIDAMVASLIPKSSSSSVAACSIHTRSENNNNNNVTKSAHGGKKWRGCGCGGAVGLYGPRPPKKKSWKEAYERYLVKVGSEFKVPGFDFRHWCVYLKPIRGPVNQSHFVSYYLDTISHLFPSKEEAVNKIYSMAVKHYFLFGAHLSPEQADFIQALPNVVKVLPDRYLVPEEKRYPFDPYVNGKLLPYDPSYYEAPGMHVSQSDEQESDDEQVVTKPYIPAYMYN